MDAKARRVWDFRPPTGSPSTHLDALRGLAAFSVFISHWRDAFFLDYYAIGHHGPLTAAAYFMTGMGHQWVIIFFVMSGYLVGGSVLRANAADKWSWRAYLLTRLTRLYVVLIPALFLGGLLDWLGINMVHAVQLYSGQSGMHSLSSDVTSMLSWPILLANALFLQGFHLQHVWRGYMPTFGSNGPLWSLANEFWYYLAFPFLVLAVRKKTTWLVRAFSLCLLVAWIWFVGPGIALLAIPWLMGALIPFLPALKLRSASGRAVAIVAMLGLLLAGLYLGKTRSDIPVTTDLLLGVIVTALVWVTLHCATAPVPNWYHRLSERAARSSYTLYLMHLPLVILLKAAFNLPRAMPQGMPLVVGGAILLVVLLYGQLIYELFEKNTGRVRNWLKPYVLGRSAA